MSKLDKLNLILGLIGKFSPLVLSSVPGGARIAPFIPVITHGITEAEQIPGASGADKKAHVLTVLSDSVTALNATGKVTLDPAELQSIASNGIDNVLSVVKVIEKAHPVVPVVPSAE